MATSTPSLPDQQQPGEVVPNPVAAAASNNSAWQSSGSLGPFFAVISVLAVLAILSCVLGRICTARRTPTAQLESIQHRGCFRWLTGLFRRPCIRGDAEFGGAGEKTSSDGKAEDGV